MSITIYIVCCVSTLYRIKSSSNVWEVYNNYMLILMCVCVCGGGGGGVNSEKERR